MQTVDVFEWFNRHKQIINISAAPLLVLMVIAVGTFVYATGGIKYVYSHSMYVPIVLSGMIYGVHGGIIVAILGGLVLGPYMPIDIMTGEMQLTLNWLYRAGFFMLIGTLSGIASDTVKAYLAHLHWMSRHDTATKLPNRLALMDDLTTIKHRPDVDTNLLLVLSLASTTELKAAFGHDVIENIVRQAAQRFSHVLSSQGQVYRADTEEVSALIATKQSADIESLLHNLNYSARNPYLFEGIPLHIDSRMGYVQFKTVDGEPSIYLQQAESALNVAHHSLLDWVEYQPSLKLVSKDNMSLLGELMQAIEKQQLSLHYQPKLDLASGRVKGVEALLRWQHPTRGAIPPGTFIPCAEQSTLIQLVTKFALTQAILTIQHFQAVSLSLPVAVNITAADLCQPGFADSVLEMLASYDVSGELLELEVTEGALIRDMNHTIRELSRLAEAGIKISVDDFGTGYSSLQYLHKLPISHLKIDQSFVQRLPQDKEALHIIEAAVSLAHKLDLQTIAEGVESREVLALLAETGCDIAQGYCISRPLPANDFLSWHDRHLAGINGFAN